jgi:hypothetical protein
MSLLRSRERAQANEAAEVFSKLEGEIREVVSRGTTAPRPQQGKDNELAASNIGSLLQHVSGTSVQEIEKLIAELPEQAFISCVSYQRVLEHVGGCRGDAAAEDKLRGD